MNNLIKTNIPWLPSLKSGWDVVRVKNIFYISKEKAHQDNPTILSLARSGVKIRDISNNEGQLAESYYDYNPVKPGDLLLNPMDLYSGANCNVSEVEGVISPAYANLRSKTKLEPKFFDYYFKTQYWTMAMFAHGKGVSFDNRWTLNNETLMSYELPLPTYEEQEKIVLLLKYKISKIDELIDNQEKQINKIKEFKLSLISSLIDSIDGKFKKPLKYNVLLNQESLSEKTDGDFEFDYVEIGAVDLENGIKKYEHLCFKDAPSRARRVAYKDDVIVSTVRTYLKAIAIVGVEKVIVSTGFAVLRPKDIIPEFLGYVIKSDFFTNQVSSNSEGISYPAINSTDLMNLNIVVPDVETQIEIVNLLNSKMKMLDELIKIKQEKIEKLQEYKKSLIYEYVTGKKEV